MPVYFENPWNIYKWAAKTQNHAFPYFMASFLKLYSKTVEYVGEGGGEELSMWHNGRQR